MIFLVVFVCNTQVKWELLKLPIMILEERLEFCKICQNRKVDFKTGLVCSLTNEKPEFEDTCKDFVKDEKEAERVLKLKLGAAGGSSFKAEDGSLNPKRNINYGIAITIIGIGVLILYSIVFGILLIIGGVTSFLRGKKQEQILAENKELNEKMNGNNS